MSESTHTPGPWSALRDRRRMPPWRIEATGALQGWIADVQQVGKDDSPEIAANARLIATAPDLLEALRDFVEHYGYDGAAEDQRIERQARAALAKAEGRAP